ncbi:MAG: hypothetical protein ACK5XS_10000 [Armatimonadota bacterium]
MKTGNGIKVVLGIIGVLIGLFVIGKVISFLSWAASMIIPIAIVGGIGYVVYRYATRNKALEDNYHSLR